MAGVTAPIAHAIAAYHGASWAVLNDADVWRQESINPETRLLAWPRPAEGTQRNRLLSVLFNADVNVVLVLLKERDDPLSPAWPPDVRDPRMQALLRVVQRSMDAGHAAMVAQFGGLELSRRRDYINGVIERMAAEAIASGMPTRDAAFVALGIDERRGYRARKRTITRKK
jgi:hypothetical protein